MAGVYDTTHHDLACELVNARQRINELESRLASGRPPPRSEQLSLDSLTFADLFDLDEIQRIQDAFAHATGVAAIITTPDGAPLTRPSNFCRLCSEVIRKTEKGLANCMHSDALIGQPNPSGPIMQPCLSGGLWDAGASLYAGDRHLANWLIGQVRNSDLDEERLLAYGQDIGADPDEFRSALAEVTVMSTERFRQVSTALFLIANLLSRLAFHNLQQALELSRRSEIEKMLRESEETFRGIIDNMQDAYYRSDAEGRLVMCSPSILNLLGYDSFEEIMGVDIAKQFYIRPADRRALLQKLSAEGKVSDYEVTLRRKDGQAVVVRTSSHFYHDREGRILGVEGVFNNITQRKLMEQELARLNKRLEETVDERTRELADKAQQLLEANRRLIGLDQAKSAFLSSISHELRTPMTSVIGFAKLIRKDVLKLLDSSDGCGVDRPRIERILTNLQTIGQEGERLTRLLNDFLDLTKIESGHIHWNEQPTDPLRVLSDALALMGSLFAEKPEVELRTDLPAALPDIVVDPDRLAQVCINLVSNALKFTSAGSVTVRARATTAGLEIQVRDTGIGIPPESQQRIFEKFQQAADEYALGKPSGTGLGLAICREIVEHYAGRIWVESVPGRGSTFTVQLPPTCPCSPSAIR